MIMEVFSPEDARKYAEYMYDPAFRPEPHQADWVHTALAAAAGFTALRSYNDHLAAQGKGNLEQPDPATMKDTLAGYASSEVDNLVSMKGLNFIDAQRAKTHAAEEALYLATQQYSSINAGKPPPPPVSAGGEAASYYNAGPSTHQAPAYTQPSGPPPVYQAHTSSSSMGYNQAPQVAYAMPSAPLHLSSAAYGDHKASPAPQQAGYAMPPQPAYPSGSAYGNHKTSSPPLMPPNSAPGASTVYTNIANLSDRDRRRLEKDQRKAQRRAEKEQMKGMSKEAKRAFKEQRRAARREGKEERRARRRGGRRRSGSSSSSSSSSDSD